MTNPAPINGNERASLNADDDGGYFKERAQAYYASGALLLPGAPPAPEARGAPGGAARIGAGPCSGCTTAAEGEAGPASEASGAARRRKRAEAPAQSSSSSSSSSPPLPPPLPLPLPWPESPLESDLGTVAVAFGFAVAPG